MAMQFDFSELSILTIDDSPQMLAILRECLKAFGAVNIHEADDAADAFEIIRTQPVDLVIVDYLMEPLDGLDFIRLVRTAQDSPNKQLPIILLTAYTELSRVKEARDAGASGVMQKPISAANLYDRICTIICSEKEFIRGRKFTGPDRRRKPSMIKMAFSGEDKRSE
ncbi:MAG: response regulator [Gammaproteobacteria bacterium]|nr:response regulator [Gammaproteobacteria bacterium]